MPFVIRIAALAVSAVLQAIGNVAGPATPPTTPHERLLAAAHESSLNDEALKPWHLKLDVTVFDALGKDPKVGTIETWHSGKQARTVFTFGNSKRTLLHTEKASYESLEGSSVPALTDFVLSEFLDPGPSPQDIDDSTIELHVEPFGKVKLDCIMLTQKIKHEEPFAMGLFPTYCLEQGGDELRAYYNYGSHSLLRNGLGRFQGRQVATHISLMEGQIQIADARATAFTTFSPSPDFFQPESALTATNAHSALVSGGVISGAVLNKTTPVYPQSAKAKHLGGTVVLRAIIGRDGHIYYLCPVSAPDTSLAVAAIQAVKQWTYKPYLLNGMPTEVDTTITVSFNLNSY